MSLIDTLKALAITVRNEKKKEANSAVRIGDLFIAIIDFIRGFISGQIRQEGVDTYNDTSEGKTSLLNTYTKPEIGWTVLVRNDEKNGEKAVLYQWNGKNWIDLEQPIMLDDVATREEVLNRELVSETRNNVFLKGNTRSNLIVMSPSGNISKWTQGFAMVSEYIPIPEWADTIYTYSDQSQSGLNSVLKNDTNDSSGGTFIQLPIDGKTDIEKEAYKYLVVTIVRDSDVNYLPNLDNIRIGFTPKFKDNTIRDTLIDVRTLSKDYNCFERYKDDDTDKIVLYDSKDGVGRVTESNYLRSVISLKLTGFDNSKPHKLTLLRRGRYLASIPENSYDYSIIISVFDNEVWSRAAYFRDYAMKYNPEIKENGINEFSMSLDSGHKIEAVIDYSFIPNNSSGWLQGTEDGEPNFIIKRECFVTNEVPQNLIDRLTTIEDKIGEIEINREDWVKNIPVSDNGSDIELGYAYIDESTGSINVKV